MLSEVRDLWGKLEKHLKSMCEKYHMTWGPRAHSSELPGKTLFTIYYDSYKAYYTEV